MTPISVTIDITVNRDPSGGCGEVQGALVTGPQGTDPILITEPGTEIQFSFAGDSNTEAVFTAFRYASIWRTHAGVLGLSAWAKPANAPASQPGVVGQNVSYATTPFQPGPTMTVIDNADYNAFYLYIVEWELDGNTYVCDPKIRNQPAGGSVEEECDLGLPRTPNAY